MIIPVFQPIGASTHMLAKKAGQIYREKATHTGTLDPMAKGVVIVMTGEDRFNKESFNKKNDKTYKFTMLFGVETDSYDLLGLITKDYTTRISHQFSLEEIKYMIQETYPLFIGNQDQEIPAFSAKRMHGKSYFDAAKKGTHIPKATEPIKIHQLRPISIDEIEVSDFKNEVFEKLDTISGNFRQEKIKVGWQEYFSTLAEKNVETLYSAEFYTRVSRRTYIRGLVRDISQRTGIPATTTEIFRVKNGEYGVKDCVCLL